MHAYTICSWHRYTYFVREFQFACTSFIIHHLASGVYNLRHQCLLGFPDNLQVFALLRLIGMFESHANVQLVKSQLAVIIIAEVVTHKEEFT